MGLVYIIAAAPLGPVQIRAAADYDELRDACTAERTSPAHVEDVGELSPEQVAHAARSRLSIPDAMGWIADRLINAQKAVQDGKASVSAMVVAETSAVDSRESFPVDPGPSGSDISDVEALADVDVKAVRARLSMTQAAFAKAFSLPVTTVQGWEQKRFRPDGPAAILLRVIQRRPDAVREALAGT